MLRLVFEIPDAISLKDKRKVLRSIKDRLIRTYKLSAAEVDLNDSVAFAELGACMVSNSREFGESVLGKAITMVEDDYPVRIHDAAIHSERY
jgi:hypothetical protein